MSSEISKEQKIKLFNLLNTVTSLPEAVYFLEPVNWESLGLTDYPTIITEPKDFSTIRKKLDKKGYGSIKDVLEDVQTIYDNCMLYNEESSEIFKAATKMQEFTKIESAILFGNSLKYGQKSKSWIELQNQKRELQDFEELCKKYQLCREKDACGSHPTTDNVSQP